MMALKLSFDLINIFVIKTLFGRRYDGVQETLLDAYVWKGLD